MGEGLGPLKCLGYSQGGFDSVDTFQREARLEDMRKRVCVALYTAAERARAIDLEFEMVLDANLNRVMTIRMCMGMRSGTVQWQRHIQ